MTHWEIQVFSGFQVNWCDLGDKVNLTYIYTALSSLGPPVSTIHPMEPADVGFTPGPPEN